MYSMRLAPKEERLEKDREGFGIMIILREVYNIFLKWKSEIFGGSSWFFSNASQIHHKKVTPRYQIPSLHGEEPRVA